MDKYKINQVCRALIVVDFNTSAIVDSCSSEMNITAESNSVEYSRSIPLYKKC